MALYKRLKKELTKKELRQAKNTADRIIVKANLDLQIEREEKKRQEGVEWDRLQAIKEIEEAKLSAIKEEKFKKIKESKKNTPAYYAEISFAANDMKKDDLKKNLTELNVKFNESDNRKELVVLLKKALGTKIKQLKK